MNDQSPSDAHGFPPPVPPQPVRTNPASATQPSTIKPRVGSWGWAIFFFGWLGGIVGYFSLKSDDPRRANHVAKWGVIVSAIWSALWLLAGAVFVIVVGGSSARADDDTGSTLTESELQEGLDEGGDQLCETIRADVSMKLTDNSTMYGSFEAAWNEARVEFMSGAETQGLTDGAVSLLNDFLDECQRGGLFASSDEPTIQPEPESDPPTTDAAEPTSQTIPDVAYVTIYVLGVGCDAPQLNGFPGSLVHIRNSTSAYLGSGELDRGTDMDTGCVLSGEIALEPDPPETWEEERCNFSTEPLEVPALDEYTGGVPGEATGAWGRAESYDLAQEHIDAGSYELVAENFG